MENSNKFIFVDFPWPFELVNFVALHERKFEVVASAVECIESHTHRVSLQHSEANIKFLAAHIMVVHEL